VFIVLNKTLIQRPLYRNVPEGADADISQLPGGDDDLISVLGAEILDAEIAPESVQIT
jgi:hypothetical protein